MASIRKVADGRYKVLMAAIKCCGASQSETITACQRASCARPPKLLRPKAIWLQ